MNALNLCKIYDQFNAKLCKIYAKLNAKLCKIGDECVEFMQDLRSGVDLT